MHTLPHLTCIEEEQELNCLLEIKQILDILLRDLSYIYI
jgi:hypothetical protein